MTKTTRTLRSVCKSTLIFTLVLLLSCINPTTLLAVDYNLTATDTLGNTSWNTALNWSGGGAPSAGNDYFTNGFVLRTTTSHTNQTFQGDSLTINGGSLFFKSRGTKTINNLIMDGGAVNNANVGGDQIARLDGNISTISNANFNTGSSNDRKIRVSSDISGVGSVTVLGSGDRVELRGNNTYTGGTFITGSELRVYNANALGTGSLTLNSGAHFFSLDDGVTINNDIILNNNVDPSAGNGVIYANGTATLTGTITLNNSTPNGGHFEGGTGGDTLNINGAINSAVTVVIRTGDVQLGGGGTYTSALIGDGSITLSADDGISTSSELRLNQNWGATSIDLAGFDQTLTGLYQTGAGSSVVTNSSGTASTLTINNSTDYTYAGNVTGNLSLSKSGSNRFTISGTNTYTGTTSIQEGELFISNANALPSTTAISMGNNASAVLNLNNISKTIAGLSGGGALGGNVSMGTGTLTTGGNNASTTYDGVISGTGGLTKTGTGALQLGGANTYTGTTTIQGGILRLSNVSALTNDNVVVINNTAGVALDLDGFDQTVGSISGGGALGGNITLGAGTLTTGGNNASTTYDGVISGTGGLTKTGAGTLQLGGSSTYSGTTSIQQGTIQATSASALSSSSTVALSNVAGVSLDLNNNDQSIGGLSGGGALGGNVTLGNATLTVGGNNSSTTYDGVISGTGGLTKTGSGTLELGAANTFTGAVSIQGGTLQLSHANALPNTVTLALSDTAGTQFDLNNTDRTIASLSGGGSSGGNVSLGTGTLTTGGNNASTSFDGAISGTGGLTKTGTGTLQLGGASTYSGATTVQQGTLQLTAASALSSSSQINLSNTAGVLLDLNDNDQSIGSLTGGGALGGNVTLGSGTLTTGNDNASTTYDGIISGTGGLTKTGSGTLDLTGANTYTGTTSIQAGTLKLSNASTLASTTTLELSNTTGAQLDMNNNDQTVGSLSGGGSSGGNITLGSGSLTLGANNNSTTYDGVISGTGGLTKTGTGTLQLGGNNTYSGTTMINAGAIELSSTGQLASDTVIASDSRLGGTGRINGNVTNQGTVRGGSTTTTTRARQISSSPRARTAPTEALTIDGNYTQTSTGTLELVSTSSGISGLTITGSASLDGTLNVSGTAPRLIVSSYDIITAQGGLGGTTFNTITTGLNYLLDYLDGRVQLTLFGTGFADLADTDNQLSTATYLDDITPTASTELQDALNALSSLSNEEIPAALDLLSPEYHSMVLRGTLDIADETSSLINNKLMSLRQADRLDDPKFHSLSKASRITTWAQAYGALDKYLASVDSTGFSSQTTGGFFGIDSYNGKGRHFGFTLNVSDTSYSPDRQESHATQKTTQLGSYLSFDSEKFYVNGWLIGGKSDITTHRGIHIDTYRRIAKSETSSTHGVASLGGGMTVPVGSWRVGPSARVSTIYARIDDFTETDADALNLAVESWSSTSLQSDIGVNAAHALPTKFGILITSLNFDWSHTYSDRDQTITGSFEGSAGNFTVRSNNNATDSAKLGGGLALRATPNTDFTLNYGLEFSSGHTTNHSGTFGLKVLF